MSGAEVPPDAVEAAARVIVRTVVDRSWESLLPSRQEWYRTQARAALETAAPHIRADALDDAAKKLRSDMDVPQRIWVANKVRALAMIERGDG